MATLLQLSENDYSTSEEDYVDPNDVITATSEDDELLASSDALAALSSGWAKSKKHHTEWAWYGKVTSRDCVSLLASRWG